MDFSRQSDPYSVRFAGDLLKACQSGTADFLNMGTVPYYTQNMFTKQALPDAAQLQTLLNNAALGSVYINYAPTYMLQDSKKGWVENIKEKLGETKKVKNPREISCIVYKGKDENGYKHYEMMSPGNKFDSALANENPMNQNPVPDVGICRKTPSLDPRDPKGIEKYLTDVVGNYFNAAFTKTPYFAPQWGSQETEMLSKALNADPALAIRTSQNAFAQATSVKMENTVNQELNDKVRDAMKLGLPPFNTKKQEAVIGPVNVNGVPANGVDFVNAYYNDINAKIEAAKANTAGNAIGNTAGMATVTQNGYVPYQTHNEKPKDVDKFLVEEYGNLMNASLTGTPYSGSVTPAQLKTLSAGVEAKMEKDPAYMSGIVNQAHQNVLGCNYLPYDKENFITRARDPSSEEFKILDKMICDHINDICKNNKMSFNGEFQELSKDLTENIKKTMPEKKPAAKTTAAKTTASKTTTAKTTAGKTTGGKTTAAKTTAKPAAETTAAKTTSGKAAGAAAGKAAADEAKTSATRTAGRAAGMAASAAAGMAAGAAAATIAQKAARGGMGGPTTARDERPRNSTPVAGRREARPPAAARREVMRERPSFFREVTDFVRKNIVETKPALVLVDTFLGSMIDKAKKIVRSGHPVANAFVIAASVLAPNLQLPVSAHIRLPVAKGISISVSRDVHKPPARHGPAKAGPQQVRQTQHSKSAARR